VALCPDCRPRRSPAAVLLCSVRPLLVQAHSKERGGASAWVVPLEPRPTRELAARSVRAWCGRLGGACAVVTRLCLDSQVSVGRGETSSPRRSLYGAAANRTMVVAARPPPPPPPRALPFVAPPPPRVRTLPPPAFSGSAAGCGHYSRTVTWTEYTDEHSGHRYYVSERGETTWDRPVGAIIHRGDDAFC